MPVHLREVIAYLDSTLEIDRFKDYAPNGLQVEGVLEVDRIVTDEEVMTAVTTPPQSTRARLRGAFIKRAKERKRDYTVDWVHLKLNDQAQRTVLCKDPFKSVDERVEQLIAHM